MSIREMLEQREHEYLSEKACFSDAAGKRNRDEIKCDVRPEFQRDRDRILYSNAFRRLKGKTQVFLAPEGDHYRNRLTHTLEVSQTARTIAKALRMNEDLTEAIALGHDLGHTPFGHAGERALNRVCEEGFEHHLQSVRVVEKLEKHGKGLNLTPEVRDGILNHQTEGHPKTMEGKIVRLSDKIAYINHDVDDAIRGNIIKPEDIPAEFTDVLGFSLKERLNTFIHDIVTMNGKEGDILLSPKMEATLYLFREFMFERVYTNQTAKGQEKKAENMVELLYRYYLDHLSLLPEEFLAMIKAGTDSEKRVVCDYIAGMTDHYATEVFTSIMIPESWGVY